jgi:hypothetical protein
MTVLDDLPALLKPAEAAKVLRTSTASLSQDRFLNRGAPYIKVGKRVLYERDSLLEYLRQGVVTPERLMPARRRD